MSEIIDGFMNWVFRFLNWVVSVLPEWDPGHSDAIQGAVDMAAGVNNYVPLTEIAECIGILLAFHGLVIVWRPLMKFCRLA